MNFNLYTGVSNKADREPKSSGRDEEHTIVYSVSNQGDHWPLLKNQGVVAPMATVVQNDLKPRVSLSGLN